LINIRCVAVCVAVRVAVRVAVCVAVRVAVCVAVCVAVRVAVRLAVCVAVRAAVRVAVCVAVRHIRVHTYIQMLFCTFIACTLHRTWYFDHISLEKDMDKYQIICAFRHVHLQDVHGIQGGKDS